MSKVSNMVNDVQSEAWAIHNLISVLHAAIDDDRPGCLPVRCTLSHIKKLSEALPESIERLANQIEHASKNRGTSHG